MAENDALTAKDIPSEWIIFKALDDHQSYITGQVVFKTGDRGYAKRNDHDPKEIQILVKTGNFVFGCYISERFMKIEITNSVPDRHEQKRLDGLWSQFWKAKMAKSS